MTDERPPVYRSTFKEILEDDRPRERLKAFGPSTLSTSELLAIILNTGTIGESVTSMSQRLLTEFQGLTGLLRADFAEIARSHGVGPSRSAKIKAALELGRRLAVAGEMDRPKIGSPEDIHQIVGIEMMALEQEQLRVVLLDTKHQILAVRTIYQGSANQANVRVGELFRDAVRQNAVGVILVHNHPSGDPAPSSADIALTTDVIQAGRLLDIEVLDHVVVGHGQYVSLKRLGLGFVRS